MLSYLKRQSGVSSGRDSFGNCQSLASFRFRRASEQVQFALRIDFLACQQLVLC